MLEADAGDADKAQELFRQGTTLCPRFVNGPTWSHETCLPGPLSFV